MNEPESTALWMQFIERFGVSVAILGFLALVFWRKGLPALGRLVSAHVDLMRAITESLPALREEHTAQLEAIHRQGEQMEKLCEHMKDLREDVTSALDTGKGVH